MGQQTQDGGLTAPEGSKAAAPVLSLRGISKRFGGVQAVANVDLDLFSGEVHGLVGENGAGKSTIVKTIAGVHQPDTGTLSLDGTEIKLSGPAEVRDLGIAVVHQHPTLFPDLNVAENVFVGRLPRRGFGVNWREVRVQAQRLFDSLGVPIKVSSPVAGLSMADQQLVEIAKALSLDAKVLIMDEPTASLSGREVDRLFSIVRPLRDRGVALMIINHRLEEVFEISDRITVIRDGRHVITEMASQLTPKDVIRYMVGRQLEALFPKAETNVGEVALEVRGLSRAGAFRDISFQARRGEILALSGLVGAGRTEVAQVIFGIDQADAGEVMMGGKRLKIRSPTDAMRHGIVYVPEDRPHNGVILDFSIATNISLPLISQLSRLLVVMRSRERALAADYSKRLQVRSTGVEQRVSALSGGNQQKVVIAKWLATRPHVLILDEPTQGVDIGAKAEVYRIASELAAGGMAIIMISSELPEVLGMADRVLVFHEGKITAELDRSEATQERIMVAATGQENA